MKKTIIYWLLALVLPASLQAQSLAVAETDEAQLRHWIRTLASDEFGGRMPMTPYEDITVNYLVGEMKKLGLQAAPGRSCARPTT